MKHNKRYNTVKGYLPLFFLLVFFACKKESSEIGLGLIGGQGLEDSQNLEITNINSITVPDDTFRSDRLSTNMLGVINDPVFGLRKASLIVQPYLFESGKEFEDKTLDSVKLFLKYDVTQQVGSEAQKLSYGDMQSDIALDLYGVEEDIVTLDGSGNDTSVFYNNFVPQLGSKIGEVTAKFSFDSVNLLVDDEVVKSAPQLVITLDNSFGQEIMDADESYFTEGAEFIKLLKGIAIVPRDNPVTGKGVIVGIEAASSTSGLIFYYDGDKTKSFPLSSISKRINYFETNPSAEISSQLNGSGDFDLTYVQAMGGSKIKLETDELNSFIEMPGDIVVNEAKMEFFLDQASVTDEYSAPARMWLQIPDSIDTSKSVPITDLLNDLVPGSGWQGRTNYGGDYDKNTLGYTFRFNQYLQELRNEYKETGVNNFNGFYLSVPADYPLIPYRGVFNTNKSAETVKISVTYTKLK